MCICYVNVAGFWVEIKKKTEANYCYIGITLGVDSCNRFETGPVRNREADAKIKIKQIRRSDLNKKSSFVYFNYLTNYIIPNSFIFL